jgi:hypothetical protein
MAQQQAARSSVELSGKEEELAQRISQRLRTKMDEEILAMTNR